MNRQRVESRELSTTIDTQSGGLAREQPKSACAQQKHGYGYLCALVPLNS